MARRSKVILHPPAPFQKFPVELVDMIVDHFYNDIASPTALAALLWVSRSFANPVKRRLFRTIKITYFHPDIKQPLSSLLYKILRGDPTILEYVRKVEIVFEKEESFCDWKDSVGFERFHRVRTRRFIAILYMLSNCRVNELDICGKDCKGHTWPSAWGAPTIAAIFALRCNPHLRKLSIHHLREIPGFLITGMPSTDRVQEFSTTHAVYICQVSCRHCERSQTPLPFDPDSDSDEDEDEASPKSSVNPPECLKAYPLVQQFVKDRAKGIHPFNQLKTLYLPRKAEFPWEACFPIEGHEDIEEELCLYYSTDDALKRKYGNSEGNTLEVPRLSNFQFASLEELIIGNKGVSDAIRWRYRHTYEAVLDILDRVGSSFCTLELRERFRTKLHDLPNFPLNGIFKSGKISVFRINTEHDPNSERWPPLWCADPQTSTAFNEFNAMAAFFSHNAPLPGVKEVHLSLMWPIWQVVRGSMFENFRAGGSSPWERFCDVIKKSGVKKLKIGVRVRTFGTDELTDDERLTKEHIDELANIRTRWMEAMDVGKDVTVEFDLWVDDTEWDLEDSDSDVWY